ncbi:MAG: S-layer homology domain-containing protein [Clostridia bacterium]|nr:S-layer homology domain-containing protein [Clostridia bacterium]
MKRKCLSFMLVLAMICSLIVAPQTAVTAATYYDTDGLDCELAVDVLAALGIMSGYSDGSFLPYNTVTRAEMAQIALKLAGVSDYPLTASDEAEQFADMYGYDGWASGVVAIAAALGIAKGDDDGNFNPDDPATYDDAVQMVVCALGYEFQALGRGGELSDYVYVGRRLGITKKLSTSSGQNITRADVAKLVYAALTVDLVQKVSYSSDGTIAKMESVEGENALNTYFDVNEVDGIVTETEYAATDGETTLDEDEVMINNEVFDVGATNISDYLGYYVEAYALDGDESGDNRIIIAFSVESVKNNTLTIDAEDIDSVTSVSSGYQYSYWTNKSTDTKTKTAKTSSTPRVLYNGKSTNDVTLDLLQPDYGSVVLIDNNGDDKYDIIDVWEYELVYVFSASTTTGSVSNYYDMTTTYKFDPDDDDYHVTFLNSNGTSASLSDIDQYSILYVYESDDGEEKKVIISNASVTGSVSQIDDGDKYVINGVEYEISPAAESRVDLSVSDTGTFYLDPDGRIAAFDGVSTIRQNVGMFIAINDGGLSRGVQVKLLTQNNGVQIYNLAGSVTVNGVSMSDDEFYENAYTDVLFGTRTGDSYLNAAGLTRPDPSRAGFLYKLNSKDEIYDVVVVGDGDGDGYLQRRQIGTSSYLYYNSSRHALHYSQEYLQDSNGNYYGVRTYVQDSTVVFNDDESSSNTDDNDSYWVTQMGSYYNNYEFRNSTYDFIYAYYYSADGSEVDMQTTICNFLVMTDWYDNSDSGDNDSSRNGAGVEYGANPAPIFIYKISDAYDSSKSDETYRVYYFEGTNLKNALIRPQYAEVNRAQFDDDEWGKNGFPVRMAWDGSYIEDIKPYYSDPHTSFADMTDTYYNETTGEYVMKWAPFFQNTGRYWTTDSSSWNYMRYYLGMVTSVDDVAGNKLFTVTYSTSASPSSTSDIGIRQNERLEGTIYRVNYDREGKISSISSGSTSDVMPGQLVLFRLRQDSGDSTRYWTSYTYSIIEIYILADDANELDYLNSDDLETYPLGNFVSLSMQAVMG